MAKGNMFLGMARGSVGDVTFYRKSGQQAARARNRNPRNPKTSAQVIQRMILATASKAYSRLKSITDHSFQGIAYGSPSQSYFLKRAMDDIRAFVSANYPTATETDILNYRGLAEPNFIANAGIGLLISEGSLPSIAPIVSTGVVQAFAAYPMGEISGGGATVKQVMDCAGAEPGDQLTIVGIYGDGLVRKSRYVFKPSLAAGDLSAAWTGESAMTCLDTESIVSDIHIGGSAAGLIATSDSDLSIISAAIILSRKDGNNWLRSTERLAPMEDNIDTWLVENGPDVVIPMWEAGTAQVDTENPYYLNQAEVGE